MIRDYISYELQSAADQIKELSLREKDIQKAESRGKRKNAEEKAETARENLLADLPPTITYEFLDVTTYKASATNFRSTWQKKNLVVDDCLQKHVKTWQEGSHYYETLFKSPKINLAILPLYSFFIQFTFTLAQPYISRDEQDFYIIDNPVRKDKIFGLPYVASTSWKGSW